MRRLMQKHQSGFTLIEISAVAAIVGLLAGIALPAYQSQLMKARRADGTSALIRVQLAQEKHRAAHGLYASTLSALGNLSSSAEGLYTMALQPTGAESYILVAEGQGPQANDGSCRRLTLTVVDGFSSAGPTTRCWNQ